MIDKKMEAHDLFNSARLNMSKGNKDKALSDIERATKLYSEVYKDDANTLADYYAKLGNIMHYKLDEYDKAIDYYKRADEKLVELGREKESAYTNYLMAEIYDVDLDNLTSAAEHLNIALTKYMELEGEDNLVAECLERIASIYYRLDEYDIASNALRKATDIKVAMGDATHKTAMSLQLAGKMSFEMRYLDDAIDYLTRAYNIYLALEGELGENTESTKEEIKIIKAYKGADLH